MLNYLLCNTFKTKLIKVINKIKKSDNRNKYFYTDKYEKENNYLEKGLKCLTFPKLEI